MEIKEIIKSLNYEVIVSGNEVSAIKGYSSDLLSDVMANCPEESIWITIQRHMNVIAVAQLKKIPCIVFVNDVEPDSNVIEKSKEEGITLLKTSDNAFVAAGKLYSILNSK